MYHLFCCLGRRSKWEKNSPGVSSHQHKDVEATGIYPPARFPFKFDFGYGDHDVSQLNSTTRSNNEDMFTCQLTERLASISSIQVGPDHYSASSSERADPPESSESVVTALYDRFQSRVRRPPYALIKPVSVRTQNGRSQTNYRPQAVPIVLPNDPASKERREAALRARGLLPPQRPRDLSAIEADADRRIDILRKKDSLLSGSAPDKGHGNANEIAQSWRIQNLMWLSDTLPESNSLGNSTAKGSYLYNFSDASPHGLAVEDELASFPFYLFPTAVDTSLASQTTPTLSSQSVCCYLSSESEDNLGTTDDGEIDLSVSPSVKNVEGSLFQEIIAEGSGPRAGGDNDIDTFHNPQGPFRFTVIPCSTGDDCGTAPRRLPAALLRGVKRKGSTPGSTPPSALSNLKSASMVDLHHPMSGSSFVRTRAHSTVSRVTPRSSPPSPLIVKIYDPLELRAEVSGIVDSEARRLCELAFL